MKKFILAIFLFGLSCFSFADRYYAAGKVQDILLRPDLDAYAIVYIDGFESAGSCKRNEGQNRVILSIKGDTEEAMFSTLLAAYMSGKSVKVSLDDFDIDSDGHCKLYYLRLNTAF
jgi:hypothetical protein